MALRINEVFGSFDNFKEEFQKKAAGQFGSGWAWLVAEPGGNLRIETTQNAVNPYRTGGIPVLGWDVWEHSYYIDYRNDRAQYLKQLWRITDWDVMEGRYMQSLAR